MSASFLSKTRFLRNTYTNLCLSTLRCSTKPVVSKPTETMTATEAHGLLRRTHAPNNFEKKLLVWTGRYKSADEIPKEVPHETIEKARNKGRIKVANYMMVGTLIGCLFMAISGKRAAKRGESISKMNEDWHKDINKENK